MKTISLKCWGCEKHLGHLQITGPDEDCIKSDFVKRIEFCGRLDMIIVCDECKEKQTGGGELLFPIGRKEGK